MIPHSSMDDFNGGGTVIEDVLSDVAGEAGPAGPWLELAAQALKILMGVATMCDAGNGIYFSMTWLAPGVFIPTTRP